MAAGDYVVRRNNANTDTVPNAGSDLLLLWDTAVANVGSGITYSAGTFTLGETGHFLVLASDQHGTTSTTNNERLNTKMAFTLAGTELEEGQSFTYIRKSGGNQEGIAFSAAIINVSTTTGNGDELQVRKERIDNTVGVGEEPDRIADRSGITIIKLDDTWGYGRYESSAVTASSGTDGGVVTLNLQTTVEQDSPFTRTTNTIDIATNNLVLAIYSLKCDDTTPTGRHEIQGRLTLAGAVVPGSYIESYVRVTDNSDWGGYCNVCLLDPTSGQDLELEMITRDLGGNTYSASLQLVELPSGAEAAIMEATTGDYNATGTNFAWDTLPYIDTAAFTATAGQANIDVDNAGDYLAIMGQATTTGEAATRATPAAGFRVNTTDQEITGTASYHRNSGTAEYSALACAGLLTGLSANDSVYVRNDRIGTITTAINCNSGAFSLIRLSSLFGAAVIPSITDIGDEHFERTETNIVITGTGFETPQGTGTVEIGDSSTYATATKVTQSIDSWSDLSIQFDLNVGGGLSGIHDLWVFVTNDSGNTSTGYAISVYDTPVITDVEDEDLEYTEVNVILDGTDLKAPQGTGKLELSNNATYGAGTLVTQSIDSWSNTQIQFDVSIGALSYGTNYLYVTNSEDGVSAGYSVNLYVQHQITGTDQTSDTFYSGTSVVISGTNFGATQGTGTVELNTAADGSGSSTAASVTSWADGSITATVYLGALPAGTNYLIVKRNNSGLGDTALRNSNGYSVTVNVPGSSDGLYKTSDIVGTIKSTGFNINVFMISDE